MVANIHLLELDGDAELLAQHRHRLIAVLLEDVEDDDRLEVDVAERLGDVVAKSTGTSVERQN